MPPFTVASWATIRHSRPETRPIPVMMPAQGTSSSYMPQAASCDSSRKGEPVSISVRTRSRGSSLPRFRCRARAVSPPPSATLSTFRRKTVTAPTALPGSGDRCPIAGRDWFQRAMNSPKWAFREWAHPSGRRAGKSRCGAAISKSCVLAPARNNKASGGLMQYARTFSGFVIRLQRKWLGPATRKARNPC